MKYIVVLLALLVGSQAANAKTNERDTDLNVAIFEYLPDASTAIKKIEKAFERRYRSIDIDLELWNPYDDSFEDDGLSQIVDFDIVEIDSCRIDQLMQGTFGGLDPLPTEARPASNAYIGPAKTITATPIGQYLLPHWVCGNFLVIRSSNTNVVAAKSFDSFIEAVNPSMKKPVLAAMWGKTGLGEFYADAMLDLYGPEKTRDHLSLLASGKTDLDLKAKEEVLMLVKELSEHNKSHLEHYYNNSYLLPRQFASKENVDAVLLGYSERLYYTESELLLVPDVSPPSIKPDDVVVRQFSFGKESQGTPTWTDGFVIPKGRLSKKRAAIVAFLQFIQSEEAYLAFSEPTAYLAPSYLLPATAAAYDKTSQIVAKQPLLPKYRDVLDEKFPVSDSTIWQGMRAAGGILRKALKPNE